ncbi:hypothetical protein [Taibaiella koreensis]|uniref:hypothetical protein n=1 Tax=Taibaiella koreensis TaxID=1268548 RepID=UPI000E59F03B|nr:hypothetical protein [Taibaiella koreensis]
MPRNKTTIQLTGEEQGYLNSLIDLYFQKYSPEPRIPALIEQRAAYVFEIAKGTGLYKYKTHKMVSIESLSKFIARLEIAIENFPNMKGEINNMIEYCKNLIAAFKSKSDNTGQALKKSVTSYHSLLGEYRIYYKIDHTALESELRMDRLFIEENTKGKITAKLLHEVNNEMQVWEGNVLVSETTHAIFISLSGPAGKNISSIFLVISVPPGHIKWQITTGILSGIKDSYDGLIGLLVVIAKGKTFNEKQHSINGFINTYMASSYIESPTYADIMKYLLT